MSALAKPFDVWDYQRKYWETRITAAAFLRDHIQWYADNGYRILDVAHECGAVDTSVWVIAKEKGLLDQFKANREEYNRFELANGYPPYWVVPLRTHGHFWPTSVEELRANRVMRFWNRVHVLADDQCWPWGGRKDANGYGLFSLSPKHRKLLGFTGRSCSPHRVAFFLYYGEIDDSLTIDHLCHRRDCMNPRHMRQCTKEENLRRTWRQTYSERPSWLPPLKKFKTTRAADARTSNGPTSPPSAATDEKAAASQHENQQFTEVGGAA